MSRLNRRYRTAEDLGLMNRGGMHDLFDNQIKSAFRINDREYNFLCNVMNDDEIGIMVDNATTFTQKRLLISTIEKFLNKMDKPRKFRFYKEKTSTGKKWYVDFPEWKGDKWELEMVMGADKMLDIIAGTPRSREVYITLSLEPFNIDDTHPVPTEAFKLIKVRNTPEEGGAIYKLKEWYGVEHNLEMWLCHVTEFVFGCLPETIYIA